MRLWDGLLIDCVEVQKKIRENKVMVREKSTLHKVYSTYNELTLFVVIYTC